MRFMMLMIPRVYQGREGEKLGKDFAPGADDVAKMNKFNEDLAKAGALIALDGLHPATEAIRVSFHAGRPNAAKGPFPQARDVLGGYWIIDVKSRDEAVDWAKRVPAQDGDVIEVRQIFDMAEFPDDVRKAGESATVREAVDRRAAPPRVASGR